VLSPGKRFDESARTLAFVSAFAGWRSVQSSFWGNNIRRVTGAELRHKIEFS
jgi:hypothetical protein